MKAFRLFPSSLFDRISNPQIFTRHAMPLYLTLHIDSHTRLFSATSSNAKTKFNPKNKRSKDKPRPAVPDESKRRRITSPDDLRLNTRVSPHRAACAVRLLRIEEGGAFADLLSPVVPEKELLQLYLTLGFRVQPLDPRNTRLVTDIVAGVVRWKQYLDYIIGLKAKRELEPLLQQILRIGVYEIVKLDLPSHAAVNENVALAKDAIREGAGNMVNAILRSVIADKDKGDLPRPKVGGGDKAKAIALSIIHSHPLWMVRRWIIQTGEKDAIKLMEWNNKPPTFSLRANSGKAISRNDLVELLQRLEVSCTVSPILAEFVRISSGLQNVIKAEYLKDGICAVQDESAAMVVSVVDPKPGETIIDCCAAPGGKALFMAARLQGKGNIMAIDVNKTRLNLLKTAANAQKVESVVSYYNDDIRHFADSSSIQADKVLLDAPCTGMGVLSKKPDMRWRRTEQDLGQLKVLQDQLLDAASKLVKPDGILVYSTCSVDPGENQKRIKAFIKRHPEFKIVTVSEYVPPEYVSHEGFFVSNPIKHQLDGAFAARLQHVPK